MVQGLAFLSKKSWHTKNLANQEKVWMAEQQAAAEASKTKELAKQIQQEKEQEELDRIAGKKSNRLDRGIDWMYQGGTGEAVKEEAERKAEEYLMGKEYVPEGAGKGGDFSANENTGINTVLQNTAASAPEQKVAADTSGMPADNNQVYEEGPSVADRNELFRMRHEDPMFNVSQKEKEKTDQKAKKQALYERVTGEAPIDSRKKSSRDEERKSRTRQDERSKKERKERKRERKRHRSRRHDDDDTRHKRRSRSRSRSPSRERSSRRRDKDSHRHHRRRHRSRSHSEDSLRRRRSRSRSPYSNSDRNRGDSGRSERSTREYSDHSRRRDEEHYRSGEDRRRRHEQQDSERKEKKVYHQEHDNRKRRDLVDDSRPERKSHPEKALNRDSHKTRKLSGYGLQAGSNNNKSNSNLDDLGPRRDLLEQKRREKTAARQVAREAATRRRMTDEERAEALKAMQADASLRDGDLAKAVSQKKVYTEDYDAERLPGKASFLSDMAKKTHGIRDDAHLSLSERVAQNRHMNQNLGDDFL